MFDTPNSPRRELAESLFTPLAYESQRRLFILSDGYVGFGFISNPLTGADETTAQKLNVLLNQDYPPNSFLQVMLLASHDLEAMLADYLTHRYERRYSSEMVKLLWNSSLAAMEFMRQGTREPVERRNNVKVRNFYVLTLVKIPVSGVQPTKDELDKAAELSRASEQALATIGMPPLALNGSLLTRIMQTILHWGAKPRWQNETDLYDTEEFLNQQFLDYEQHLEVTKAGIWLGDRTDPDKRCFVKCLSPKRYPQDVHIAAAGRFIGELKHGARGIRDNFILTLNVYYPDAQSLKAKKEQQKNWIVHQTYGPIAKFVPKLLLQKQSYELLFEALDDGDRPVRAAMHLMLFCKSDEEATAAASNVKTYYRELGFQMMDDVFITRAIFVNSLPFGCDVKVVDEIQRYRTYATRHVAHLMPVLGDWKGSGTPMLQFISRNGQLMNVDLFDSQSSYSGMIAAQSGSGKSFLANYLISAYLSTGRARAYIIDVGRSYEKLCKSFGGQFIEFTDTSNICLNPFPIVDNYDEEVDMLVGIVSSMAKPTEKMSDLQVASLRRVLRAVWDRKGKNSEIDDLASALLAEEDPRIRDIGSSLYPFTRQGEYGKYFNGPNTMRFDSPFICLELEELKGRKHLQQVVLLSLIYQINSDIYLGDRSIRKICLVDEAWSLLAEGDVSQFMVAGYRRARKANGSFLVCTQSVFDLYNTPNGQAIAENSPNVFLLGQKAETINMLKETKKMDLSDGGFELLKTVRSEKGVYSEIFIKCDNGAGIARLVVDRFRQLMYTTQPDEVAALNRRISAGMTMAEAIDDLIREEKEARREAA